MSSHQTIRLARTHDEILAVRDRFTELFSVRPIGWSSVSSWVKTDYAISHDTGGFFDLAGVQNERTGEQRLMIHQVQSALTALVRHRAPDDTYFLVQARQEPGNLNGVQLAPTIQSTPANYLAFHGGRASDYLAQVFSYAPGMRIVSDSFQVDLGMRYQGKTKRAMIVDADEMLPTTDGFFWMPGTLLVELAGESGLLNPDLRTLMSVSPWSADPSRGLVPASDEVAASLAAPVRAEVVGAVTATIGAAEPDPLFAVPLAELTNWHWTEEGLREHTPRQGFQVDFYSVEAPVREVQSWTQPLVNSQGEGLSELLYRTGSDGLLEIGVRVIAEPGLVASRAVVPSRLEYPGDPGVDANARALPTGPGVVSSLESDEGGRFYQDISRYTTRPIGSSDLDLTWIRVSEFKALLRHSTTISMQLRSQASQLLALAP